MNKQMNILTGSVIAIMAAGLMGCGQGFKSTGSSSDSAKSVNIDNELQKAEAANNEAQQAMAEAAEALKAIQDSSGNINLGLFLKAGSSSNVQTSGLLSPVIDKLRATFDTVFSKVDDVKAKFADARQALLVALSRLDHNNPAQAYMIDQIMNQLKRIDAMEQQFRVQLQTLTGKLDEAVAALHKVISGATSFIPGWGFVVDFAIDYFVMSDIENFINEIKMRLLAI
jgi:hypothetical protein